MRFVPHLISLIAATALAVADGCATKSPPPEAALPPVATPPATVPIQTPRPVPTPGPVPVPTPGPVAAPMTATSPLRASPESTTGSAPLSPDKPSSPVSSLPDAQTRQPLNTGTQGLQSTAGGSVAGSATGVGSRAGSATPIAHAQTADERLAALDKQLDRSLGSFDAQLRKEQQRVAQDRDARRATVSASAAAAASTAESEGSSKPELGSNAEGVESGSGGGTRGPSSRGGGRGKRGASQSTHAGDLKSDKATNGAGASANGNGALAHEVPGSNDDDIVARRLRKAAEQETDPELREKLWKEYVEYRNNAQVK
jgi:hypothetical protein